MNLHFKVTKFFKNIFLNINIKKMHIEQVFAENFINYLQ